MPCENVWILFRNDNKFITIEPILIISGHYKRRGPGFSPPSPKSPRASYSQPRGLYVRLIRPVGRAQSSCEGVLKHMDQLIIYIFVWLRCVVCVEGAFGRVDPTASLYGLLSDPLNGSARWPTCWLGSLRGLGESLVLFNVDGEYWWRLGWNRWQRIRGVMKRTISMMTYRS